MMLAAGLSGLGTACGREAPEPSPVVVQTSLPSSGEGVKVDNLTCPVHPEAALPDALRADLVVEHRGRPLGLCGEGCHAEWAHWSSRRRDGFLDFIAGAEPR